jgi:hypothetical protein
MLSVGVGVQSEATWIDRIVKDMRSLGLLSSRFGGLVRI